ncbi:major facilitator superfamily domain-containing protein 9-like [Schistocerca americana]|uniref:major facilitator superfamily domain-containing protein 9-like n=1 Tax=Schistocerca americana TaxID=7009 RepID=UPI001F4F7F5C|nr:major facilitator superfamily domain-containing protein 9-like [Schistocerca americana]
MYNKDKIKWLYVSSFLDMFAVGLAVPLLSAYMRNLGASHFMIGVSSSVYSGIQLLSGPLVGSWSDIYGRYQILMFVLAVCSVCYSFIGLTTALSTILFLRFVLGTFKHTQTLCRPLVAELAPPEFHSEMYGKMSAMSGIGFMVGPAIGGHLAELDGGMFLAFQLAALLFLLNTGIVYKYLWTAEKSNSAPVLETQIKPTKTGVLKIVAELTEVDWSFYWDLFIIKFLLSFAQKVFYSNYSSTVQEKFDLTPKWVGYTISFQGMIGAICAFSVSWIEGFLFRNWKTKSLVLLGFLLLSFAFFAVSVVEQLNIFVFFLIPLSFSFSLLRILSTKMIINRTDPNKRGSVTGASNSISSIARLIAPLCSGAVLEYLGPSSVPLLSVASSFCGVLLAAAFPLNVVPQKKYS